MKKIFLEQKKSLLVKCREKLVTKVAELLEEKEATEEAHKIPDGALRVVSMLFQEEQSMRDWVYDQEHLLCSLAFRVFDSYFGVDKNRTEELANKINLDKLAERISAEDQSKSDEVISRYLINILDKFFEETSYDPTTIFQAMEQLWIEEYFWNIINAQEKADLMFDLNIAAGSTMEKLKKADKIKAEHPELFEQYILLRVWIDNSIFSEIEKNQHRFLKEWRVRVEGESLSQLRMTLVPFPHSRFAPLELDEKNWVVSLLVKGRSSNASTEPRGTCRNLR